MTKNDIFERLCQGDSVDSIAQELTAMLNEANADYIEAQKQINSKQEEANAIARAVDDFIRKYYPKMGERLSDSENGGEVLIRAIDSIYNMTTYLEELLAPIEEEVVEDKSTAEAPEVEPTKSFENRLLDFINKMKW